MIVVNGAIARLLAHSPWLAHWASVLIRWKLSLTHSSALRLAVWWWWCSSCSNIPLFPSRTISHSLLSDGALNWSVVMVIVCICCRVPVRPLFQQACYPSLGAIVWSESVVLAGRERSAIRVLLASFDPFIGYIDYPFKSIVTPRESGLCGVEPVACPLLSHWPTGGQLHSSLPSLANCKWASRKLSHSLSIGLKQSYSNIHNTVWWSGAHICTVMKRMHVECRWKWAFSMLRSARLEDTFSTRLISMCPILYWPRESLECSLNISLRHITNCSWTVRLPDFVAYLLAVFGHTESFCLKYSLNETNKTNQSSHMRWSMCLLCARLFLLHWRGITFVWEDILWGCSHSLW